jgi:hypothetical protein
MQMGELAVTRSDLWDSPQIAGAVPRRSIDSGRESVAQGMAIGARQARIICRIRDQVTCAKASSITLLRKGLTSRKQCGNRPCMTDVEETGPC